MKTLTLPLFFLGAVLASASTVVTFVGSDFPSLLAPNGVVVSPRDIQIGSQVLDLMCYDLDHNLAYTWTVDIFDGDNLAGARGFGTADFPAIFVLATLMAAEPANLVDLQLAMWHAGGTALPLLNATQQALYDSAHTAGLALTTAQLHTFKVYSPICEAGTTCVESQALVGGSVPEPATLGLIGAGLLAIGLGRKRRLG